MTRLAAGGRAARPGWGQRAWAVYIRWLYRRDAHHGCIMVGMEKTDLPPPEDAVFTAELAAMMGVKPGTVKHYVSQAGKGWPNGRSRPGFPDPDGRSLIDVASPSTPGQPTRRAWVPWWRRGTVDAFLGLQRGERVRDDKGRWLTSD